MNRKKNFSIFAKLLVISLLFSSCSKKIDPETSLIRNNGSNSTTASEDGFNNGSQDDFSLAGESLEGTFDNDLLAPREVHLWMLLVILSIPFALLSPCILVLISTISTNPREEKLAEIADFLKTNPKAKLLIEGYCDWKGTPAYNKSLGDRRATTVKAYLTDLGGDPLRLKLSQLGMKMLFQTLTVPRLNSIVVPPLWLQKGLKQILNFPKPKEKGFK